MANSHIDDKWAPESGILTALADAVSAAVLIPGWINGITVNVIPGGGGSAILYHTTDDKDTILNSPGSVTWVAWDAGSVTTTTSKSTRGPITAVKLAAVGATATAKIAGERRAR